MPSETPDVGIKPFDSEKVPFDYIKGSDFRVIRADGVIGALTPNGHLHFALYSERLAIPRRVVHRLVDGQLGEPIAEESVSRNSVVRELHADVFMTPTAATELRDWLNERIQEFEARGRGG